MKITNILIQQVGDMQQISWFYKNRECYFENPGHTDPIDIMEWILSMSEEDMGEHYKTAELDYIGRTLQHEGSDPEYYLN